MKKKKHSLTAVEQQTLNRPTCSLSRTSGSRSGAREISRYARVRERCARIIIADSPYSRAVLAVQPREPGRRDLCRREDDADDDVDGADASRRSSRRGDVCEAGMRNPAVGGVSNGGARAGCGGEGRQTWAQVRTPPRYLPLVRTFGDFFGPLCMRSYRKCSSTFSVAAVAALSIRVYFFFQLSRFTKL